MLEVTETRASERTLYDKQWRHWPHFHVLGLFMQALRICYHQTRSVFQVTPLGSV